MVRPQQSIGDATGWVQRGSPLQKLDGLHALRTQCDVGASGTGRAVAAVARPGGRRRVRKAVVGGHHQRCRLLLLRFEFFAAHVPAGKATWRGAGLRLDFGAERRTLFDRHVGGEAPAYAFRVWHRTRTGRQN